MREVQVSFKPLVLRRHERIVGLDVRVTAGRLVSVDRLPLGWSLAIDNDPAWNPTIKGAITVGAAALDASSLKLRFIVESEPATAGIPVPPRLDMHAEVITTTDFAREERRIQLDIGGFDIIDRSD
jgi:hypothetical protein